MAWKRRYLNQREYEEHEKRRNRNLRCIKKMLKIVLEEETNCLCQKMLRDPKGKKLEKITEFSERISHKSIKVSGFVI